MNQLPPSPLVLASGSIYRRALLERLHLPFESVSPDVDEHPVDGETPRATARRLSEAKATAIAMRRPDAIVIGSDQVAECEGLPIGKPGTHERARAQLLAMSGRVVLFHSGVCLIAPENGMAPRVQCDVITTTVRFRDLTAAEIDVYLALEQPYDCAGSAKAEALGIALLARVESDDPTALIGLPLIRLIAMLAAIGRPVLAGG